MTTLSNIASVSSASNNKSRKLIPYAYIRFANEAVTMEQSLNSILAYCNRGVIGYAQTLPGVKTDQSLEIAKRFCAQHSGFKLVYYPVPVIPHNTPEVFDQKMIAKLDRYNYLDCYYNYVMIHLIELAKANGEYDQACLFKVDVDHIYSPVSLEYAHQFFEERLQDIDIIYYSKFNVSTDLLEALVEHYNPSFNRSITSRFMNLVARYYPSMAEQRQRRFAYELRKYLNLSDLHPQTGLAGYRGITQASEAFKLINFNTSNIRHVLFNSYQEHCDHFLVKLNKLKNFECLITIGNNTMDGRPPNYYWEVLRYQDDIRLHYTNFAVSYHFSREKFYTNDTCLYQAIANPAGDALFFKDQLVFHPFQDQAIKQFFLQHKFKDEFWTVSALTKIVQQFNYTPYLLTNQFLRTSIDYEELTTNPSYKLSNYIHKLEVRLASVEQLQLTEQEVSELQHELHCLQLLCNKYTVPIIFNNYHNITMVD